MGHTTQTRAWRKSNEISENENAILQENRGLRALPWHDHRRHHLLRGIGGRFVVRLLCFRKYLHRRPDLSQYHLGVLPHDDGSAQRSQLRPFLPRLYDDLCRRLRRRAPHRGCQLEELRQEVQLHPEERRRRRRQGDPESHRCLKGQWKAPLQISRYVSILKYVEVVASPLFRSFSCNIAISLDMSLHC